MKSDRESPNGSGTGATPTDEPNRGWPGWDEIDDEWGEDGWCDDDDDDDDPDHPDVEWFDGGQGDDAGEAGGASTWGRDEPKGRTPRRRKPEEVISWRDAGNEADVAEIRRGYRSRTQLLNWLADEVAPHLKPMHQVTIMQMLRHARQGGVFQVSVKHLAAHVGRHPCYVYTLRSQLVRLGVIEPVVSVLALSPTPYRFTPGKFRESQREKGRSDSC